MDGRNWESTNGWNTNPASMRAKNVWKASRSKAKQGDGELQNVARELLSPAMLSVPQVPSAAVAGSHDLLSNGQDISWVRRAAHYEYECVHEGVNELASTKAGIELMPPTENGRKSIELKARTQLILILNL